MDKETLVEIIRRVGEESLSPEQGILLNLECSSSEESVLQPFIEHLSAKGSARLADCIHKTVEQGEQIVPFDDLIVGTTQLHDMSVLCTLVRDASSLWSGYRLVSLPSHGRFTLQYTTPNKDDALAVLGQLLVAEQERHIDSVVHQIVPQLRSTDRVPIMHHFDRLPPVVRVAPASSELIAALAGQGWNLYRSRENRIYLKSGPAQHLLIGETYLVVPACVDPKSAVDVMGAQKHAKETGQTFHSSCPGMPPHFAPSGLYLLRPVVAFEPRGALAIATPYVNFLHCLRQGHWASYNSAALPPSKPESPLN